MVPWRACDTFGQLTKTDVDLSAHLEEVLCSQGVCQLPETPEQISAVAVFIVGSAEAGNGRHNGSVPC